MDYYLVSVRFFLYFVLTNAQTNRDNSVTNQSWFWPLLAVCLALLLSIPSTLIILIYICYKKHQQSDNHSDRSSIRSNLSASRENLTYQHSHRIQGFRSPPPPYSTYDQPENLFMSPSLPPPYESPVNNPLPTTVIQAPPPLTRPMDVSSTLTNQSIQTFQA